MATDGSNAYDPSDWYHDAEGNPTTRDATDQYKNPNGMTFAALYYPTSCQYDANASNTYQSSLDCYFADFFALM